MARSLPPGSGPTALAKLALRDQLLTARHRRSPAEIGEAALAWGRHFRDVVEVRRAATVAAYVSIGNEPGTSLLLDALAGAGKRVILPVLLPDNDLDWALYEGADCLARAGRGLLEPTAAPLGCEAVAGADVVLVPGLAVSRAGLRLGRGGGSYDRALARVPAGTFTCVALYDDELDREVPGEPHDRPVRAACTPSGVRRY